MKEHANNITRNELLHLAELSQLTPDGWEAERLAAELDAMLSMLADLREVEGEAGLPEAVALGALRADGVGESLSREAALANAPEHDDTYIVVPRVVE